MVYNIQDHKCVDETQGICTFRIINVSFVNSIYLSFSNLQWIDETRPWKANHGEKTSKD